MAQQPSLPEEESARKAGAIESLPLRRRIGTKLISGFLVGAAITILVGAVAIFALNRANSVANTTLNVYVKEAELVGQLEANIAGARRYEKEFFLFSEVGNLSKREEYKAKLDNAWATVAQDVESLWSLPPESEAREHADELSQLVSQSSEKLTVVKNLMLAGKGYEEVQSQYEDYKTTVHALEDLSGHIHQHVHEIMIERQEELIQTQAILRNLLIITPAVAVVFALLVGIVITRSITRPVSRLADISKTIAAGDLTKRTDVTSRDELGELASSFNRMTDSLERFRDEVRRKNEKLERINMELQRQRDELSREINQRQRAEERLKQTVAKLEHSNAELEQFAHVASHDLQEPLRMVASFTQLLKRRYQGKLDKDADEFIAYAVDGASRMQRMINDLLTYSRVGTRSKEFQPTDCETVFDQAVANLHMAIEETGATVTHDLLPTVMADESQLVQLLQNLIGNAIKFHGEEPLRVHVSAEQKGKEWVFSVSDDGIGIDRQYFDRIFLAFQHLHGKEYPGTGIGLAICSKIVQRHGGRIWVESELGKGSIFYFTMPAKGSKKP